jgi:hypothetical protein
LNRIIARRMIHPMHPALRRELRVAFSLRAQPIWFRVIKWMVLLTLAALYWRAAWFWWLIGGLFVAGMALHMYYRHKTHRWTRAWGGWDDLEAGRIDPE